MTLTELRAAIEAKHRAGTPAFGEAVELQRKFSIPFACLAFAAIGIPLGIQPTRSVRSRGFSLSLAVIFVYYLLLTLGESLVTRGVLPAGAGDVATERLALRACGDLVHFRGERVIGTHSLERGAPRATRVNRGS